MGRIGRLYEEIVYGGHILALSSGSLTFVSLTLMSLPFSPELVAGAYLFTFATYALNRRVEWTQDLASHPARTRHVIHLSPYLPFIIPSCYAATFILVARGSLWLSLALVAPLALGYLYSVGSGRLGVVFGVSRLKEALLVKNLVISSTWGMIPFMVLIYHMRPLTVGALSLFAFFALRALTNSLLCDVRDLEGDQAAGIRTLPLVLGEKMTFTILVSLNTLAAVPLLLAASAGLLPPAAHFLNLSVLYGYFYILKSIDKGANRRFLCDVAADGEDLLYTPLTLAGVALLR